MRFSSVLNIKENQESILKLGDCQSCFLIAFAHAKFPTANVTNYPKFSSLRIYLLAYSARMQKSEMSLTKNQGVSMVYSFWRLYRITLSCLLYLVEVACTPWLMSPSIFQTNSYITSTSAFLVTSLALILLPPSSTYKDSSDFIEPTKIIQDNFISNS